MIIEKISIKSFGKLTDVSLEFSSGINIIEGQNEAGKSTIAAFIKYMLYGFDNEDSDKDLSERNKRINWDNGIASGTMQVLVAGKRYQISRSTELVGTLERPSYKEECTIVDLETGSPAFGRQPAGEVFFGVERDLFENTAFIGQIGDASINEGSVKESIENILFSGSERVNNQRAAAKVSVKMETLLHQGGSGGVIYDLIRRSEDFEARFKRADENNKEILQKEAKLHEIKTARKAEAERMDKLCDLDVCYRNVLIISDFDKLHDFESSLDEKNAEIAAFVAANTRADFVPNQQYLTDIAVARRGVDESYRALVGADKRYTEEKNAVGITREIEGAIELADALGGEKEILNQSSRLKTSKIKNIASIIGASLVALAALVIEIVASGALAQILPRIIFGIVGVGGVAGAIVAISMLLSGIRTAEELCARFGTENLAELDAKIGVILEARIKRDGMIRSTENARIALEEAKERYEKAKEELLEVILRWGEEPPRSALGEFLDGLEEKVRVYLDKEGELLAEKAAIESEVRRYRAILEGKSEIEVRGQVSPFKRKVLNEIDHDAILEGIENCKNKIIELDSMAEILEDELAALKLEATDPGELYSKMQANDQKIAELQDQHKAYYLALNAIRAASDNLRLEISPRLGEVSTEFMEIMTDKKYSAVDVSDGLKVTFRDENGNSKSVDFLSGGTRDLTYIAVRLALIDMLYHEKPPIAFDESFAHLDNVRAKSMMKAIKKLEEDGHQSFVFTCRAREAAIGAEISKSTVVFKLSRNDDAVR